MNPGVAKILTGGGSAVISFTSVLSRSKFGRPLIKRKGVFESLRQKSKIRSVAAKRNMFTMIIAGKKCRNKSSHSPLQTVRNRFPVPVA